MKTAWGRMPEMAEVWLHCLLWGYLYHVTLSTSLYNQWREIRTPALHQSERAYLSLVTTEKAQEDELTGFGCSFTLQRVSQLFGFKVSSPSSPYRPLPRDAFSHLHPIQWHAIPGFCSCAVNSLAQPLQWENNKKEIIFRMEASNLVHTVTTQAALSAQPVHRCQGQDEAAKGRSNSTGLGWS